jgi:hypothetical protein
MVFRTSLSRTARHRFLLHSRLHLLGNARSVPVGAVPSAQEPRSMGRIRYRLHPQLRVVDAGWVPLPGLGSRFQPERQECNKDHIALLVRVGTHRDLPRNGRLPCSKTQAIYHLWMLSLHGGVWSSDQVQRRNVGIVQSGYRSGRSRLGHWRWPFFVSVTTCSPLSVAHLSPKLSDSGSRAGRNKARAFGRRNWFSSFSPRKHG